MYDYLRPRCDLLPEHLGRMHYGPGPSKVNEDIFHTLFTSPKLPVHPEQLFDVCNKREEDNRLCLAKIFFLFS